MGFPQLCQDRCGCSLRPFVIQLGSSCGHTNWMFTMALCYLWRMIILFQLIPYTVSSSGDAHFCQTPLVQNPIVPWVPDLDENITIFIGKMYKVKQFIPTNSFVSAPLLQVCLHKFIYWQSISDFHSCVFVLSDAKHRFQWPECVATMKP